MAMSVRPFLQCVRSTLNAALCLQSFPCQLVERQNKPEVEFGSSPELLLNTIVLKRNEQAECLVEGSINSARISFRFGKADQLEEILLAMYMKFLMRRADSLEILRRIPVDGYDISFLITAEHTQVFDKSLLIDFICNFYEQVDAEISEIKLSLNSRSRAFATDYLKRLCV